MSFDRQFVATCYAAFLGREPENDALCVVPPEWPLEAVISNFTTSPEFQAGIIDVLMAAQMPHHSRYPALLTKYFRYWAADRLPLTEDTRAAIVAAEDWWDFLRLLLADPAFMALAGRGPLAVPPLPSWVMEERFERLERQRRG